MGPLSKIFGMLPGMGEIKDQINNIDEREVDRIEAIIHSMTPAERDNPKIIDGSRRVRIAKGSGVEVSDVNALVNRFFEARKMMSSMAAGKIPGMPGLPGARKQPARQQPKKKGGRRVSGNPARRNAAQPAAQPSEFDPAAAFGAGGEFDQEALEKAMAEFQLPPELRSRFSK
jgi:signal recognition particle subunit SRP54